MNLISDTASIYMLSSVSFYLEIFNKSLCSSYNSFTFQNICFVFFSNKQRKYLPTPVADHTREYQQKLCCLQHRPQNTVPKGQPLIHPLKPGQDCYHLFTQQKFESKSF